MAPGVCERLLRSRARVCARNFETEVKNGLFCLSAALFLFLFTVIEQFDVARFTSLDDGNMLGCVGKL